MTPTPPEEERVPMTEEEWAKVREFWIDHLNRHPMAAHHGLPQVRGDAMRGVCLLLEATRAALEECRREIASRPPWGLGDGHCDRCGAIPTIIMQTNLCDDCSDGVARALAAESSAAEWEKVAKDNTAVAMERAAFEDRAQAAESRLLAAVVALGEIVEAFTDAEQESPRAVRMYQTARAGLDAAKGGE